MPALDQSDRTSDIDSLFVSVLLDGPLSEERDGTMSFDKRPFFNKDSLGSCPSPNTLNSLHFPQTVLLGLKKIKNYFYLQNCHWQVVLTSLICLHTTRIIQNTAY